MIFNRFGSDLHLQWKSKSLNIVPVNGSKQHSEYHLNLILASKKLVSADVGQHQHQLVCFWKVNNIWMLLTKACKLVW